MIIYIVMKNDEVDQVFSSLLAAENHVKNHRAKPWVIGAPRPASMKIISRMVDDFS